MENSLLLGIDTCGPTGSVALGRVTAGAVEMLGERELAGRSYSSTLSAALRQLVGEAGLRLADLTGVVVVHGPGSFTGVRVGVSSAMGLAEGLGLSVVAISRLEVLAVKAGVASAALDAHRDEVFLRLAEGAGSAEELLAGAEELAAVDSVPERVAVCDEAAARLLAAAWPSVEMARVAAPLASDALNLGAQCFANGGALNAAQLDGHYLRRSDAEIFGDRDEAAKAAASGAVQP